MLFKSCMPGALALLAIGIAAPSALADDPIVSLLSGGSSSAGLTPVQGITNHLGSFNLVISPGSGLSGNAAALAAFNRAAAQWAAKISDPITVTVNANLSNLGSSSIIGQTNSVTLAGGYTVVRNAMVADAADEGTDDTIVASLPTAAQFSAVLPAGFSLSGNIDLTKANAKALGFTGLDTTFGTSDGTITFNSQFSFDFDNSNGVSPGTVDFETVAAHEIGHLLGFTSEVDTIDVMKHQSQTGAVAIAPLDLFRFQNNVAGRDPSSAADFTSFPRFMNTASDAITDEVSKEYRMSTGQFTGDGHQASHWKDDALTGTTLGIMDPTLANATVETVGSADFRALDLIGYEIVSQAAAPEPASLAFLGMATLPFVGMVCRRRA